MTITGKDDFHPSTRLAPFSMSGKPLTHNLNDAILVQWRRETAFK